MISAIFLAHLAKGNVSFWRSSQGCSSESLSFSTVGQSAIFSPTL